jgi:hypothetical protein
MNKYKVNTKDVPIVREALSLLEAVLNEEIASIEESGNLGEHSSTIIKRARVLHMHYQLEAFDGSVTD